MLGLGAWELAAVLVVALVVLGPDKIPEVARKLARLVGQARRMADDVKRNIDDALQEEPAQNAPPPSAFTDWVQRQQERGNAPPEGTLAASDAAEPPATGELAAPHADGQAERAPEAATHDATTSASASVPAASAAANAPAPSGTPVTSDAAQTAIASAAGAPAGAPVAEGHRSATPVDDAASANAAVGASAAAPAAPTAPRPERDDEVQP